MIPLNEIPHADHNLVPLTDYGISELKSFDPNEVIDFKALKIVRALSGELELRLLSEQHSGTHIQYVLQTSTLGPYTQERKTLLDSKGREPITLEHAIRAFNALTVKTLPVFKHSSGKKIATHVEIL